MKIKQFFKCLIISLLLPLSGCVSSISKEESKSLIIAKLPNKLNYNVDEAFTLEGLSVVDDDGNKILDYASSIAEGTILKETGTKDVKLTKKNYSSASFKIEVKDLPRLTISHMPNKLEYVVGEFFTIEGLVVIDQNNEVVTDYTLSYRTGDAFTTTGEKEITISKEDYIPASFTVNVLPVLALTIDHMPNKTEYELGDEFDSTGLSIGDNRGRKNLAYTLSLNDGDTLKYAGTIPVEVFVTGYDSISFDITVEDTGIIVPKEDQTINIYYINDTHGSFVRDPSNYEAGMAYISSYMKEKKADPSENAIILSGGDMYEGGCESNDTRGKIMTEAMNIAGFDAMTLGNHEFDWGEQKIIDNVELMNFPLLSCNTFYSSDRSTRPSWLEPFTIIQRNGVKVGIIGYARNNMGSSIDEQFGADFYFPSPFGYIKQYSTTLRMSYGCDLILAVGHDEGLNNGSDGYGTDYYDLGATDPVTNCKYVDGMMFAHDHYRKTGVCNGMPFMETGSNAKNIGHMKFEMKCDNGVNYYVNDYDVEVYYSYQACQTEDSAVTALIDKYRSEFLADPDSIIAYLPYSYSKLEFCRLICKSMVWYVNTNPNLFDDTHVYLGSHNDGGVRVDTIYGGNLTYRDLIKAYPFDNNLVIQTCSEYNVNNIRNDTYNEYWQEVSEIPFTNGYTKCVSISYIALGKYANNKQTSIKMYEDLTAKLAFIRYLQSGQSLSL